MLPKRGFSYAIFCVANELGFFFLVKEGGGGGGVKRIIIQCNYRAMLCEFSVLTKPINIATSPHTVTHHIVMTGPSVYFHCKPLISDRFLIAKAEFEHIRELRIICPSNS